MVEDFHQQFLTSAKNQKFWIIILRNRMFDLLDLDTKHMDLQILLANMLLTL